MPRFRRLLVPLMYDPQREVALEAIKSAGRLGGEDYIFVPALVSLLRNRLLKASARQVLVGYGEGVIDTLAYFLRDPDEDIWVRRHIPSTLALIPSQKTMNVLVDALSEGDGFLRFKVINALLRLKQSHPQFTLPAERVQPLLVQESNRYFSYLSLHYNLVHKDPAAKESLIARALFEKLGRTLDRLYKLLGLLYPWKDISAARWSLEHGDARVKASAAEYLDNLLDSQVRKRVMPVLEDLPIEEKVRRGNLLLKTRVRDAEDSLAQLVHDEDQIVAAAAMHFVEQRGLWANLADDLEYELEHRDPKDWFVFEAASWTLAGQRLTAEQRQTRWLEPLPAVELADRLARLPLFKITTVDELFRIAGTGRQVRHEPGRTIYDAGRRAVDLQFLLDGSVTRVPVDEDGTVGAAEEIAGPASFGFDEVFEGVPQKATVKASGIAICLSLLNEQFLGLLSENTELAQGVFRMLLDTHGGTAWGKVLRDVAHPPSAARLRDGLQTIEKVLVLEEMPVFSRASSDQLAALAGDHARGQAGRGRGALRRRRRAGHPHRPRRRAVARADARRHAAVGRRGRLHRRLRDARRARPDRLARSRHSRRRGPAGRARGAVRPARRSDRPVARSLQRAAAANRDAGATANRRRVGGLPHAPSCTGPRVRCVRSSTRPSAAQQPAASPKLESVPGMPIAGRGVTRTGSGARPSSKRSSRRPRSSG